MTDLRRHLGRALGDRYRLERELGRGGMALVFLAEDLKHERKVALKTLRPELASSVGTPRFLREIRIAAKLNHPNILTLIDSGEAGGFLYFVMPYVEGESLRDRLTREKQLSLEDALQIASEVSDALSYAHSHGVIHRDIKPENILFEAGHAVVTDFGIASALTDAGSEKLTETGLVVGTPAYMSPEQATGVGEVDARSDIYSLACVLYEMLAGTPPHTGATSQAILARKAAEGAPSLRVVRDRVPPYVEDAVARALARVPADRFATAQQFADALSGGGRTRAETTRSSDGLMLSLRVFGGLTLSTPEGPIAGRASQRRRLALLAILAHARGRPVSRDKLVALLWPETDAERARHLLADSVYVLRDTLGDDVLATMGDDVSLNAERISSDLGAFHADLEAGDRAGAVERYAKGGPFLDGVHLSDAPEFERWVDAVRGQLTEEYRRALEELAKAASHRGDHDGAIARWRQLAVDDALNSRVALALMRELAQAGDVAGALAFARTHERVVRAELESAPDPAVMAFAEELRGASEAATRRRKGTAVPPEEPPESVVVSAVRIGAVAQLSRRRVHPAIAYAVAVLTFGVAVFVAAQMRRGRAAERSEPESVPGPSIAVLPFANLSANADDAGLADGMTEELIAMLAKLGRLPVIASTSVYAFKGRQTDVRRIADSLQVSHVLEGGLQRVGSRLRVQVRLVDAGDGTTLWSETYNREMQDVFAVQDDIARAVARELDVRLGGRTGARLLRHQTENIAAYEFYLRGRDPTLTRSDSGMWLGVEYFKQAVAADPTYAAAYAGLAHMYGVLGLAGFSGIPTRELLARAEEAAQQALALDDSLGEAHMELGFIRLVWMHDLASAEAALNRALALDPNLPEIRQYLPILHLWRERPVEALAEARRALAHDPLSARARREVARALYYGGRCDEALAMLQPLAAVRPPLRASATIAGLCYQQKQMWPEAIAELRRLVESGGTRALALLGYTLARAGQRDEARRVQADLLALRQRNSAGASDIAMVYAGLGDFDEAFAWLERAVDERTVVLEFMGPAFAELRSDPRFERVRRRLRLQKR